MRATVVLICLLSTAVAGELEYTLTPGTVLVWEAGAEATGGFSGKAQMTLRAHVLRRNDDGTCRVVFSRTTSDVSVWSWCDMAPDGSYEPNITTARDLEPDIVLPLLPRKDAAPRTLGLQTFTYEVESPGVFSFTTQSAVNRVYGVTKTSRVTMKDGLPAELKLRQEQRFGLTSTQKATVRLKGSQKLPDGFAAEADAFFAAHARYERDTELAVLENALANTKHEGLRKSLQDAIAAHAATQRYAKKKAELRAKFVGQPSPEWKTHDFAGREHSLVGHRGSVVLLDFWFRGCGWCVMAMPALKEITTRFAGKPVVLLGMNVDRKESDARHVIEALELNYPNLQARGINDTYEVQGYPTLIVIDKKGIVRALHLGFTANLKDELIAEIEKLLAE